MILMAQLAVRNPTARTITIHCDDEDGDGAGVGPFQLEWRYDRAARTFMYSQANRRVGVTDYFYSNVTDGVFTALAQRAASEYIDYSFVEGYGCPSQQFNNGKAVPVMP